MITALGSTPSSTKMASCSTPMVPASVWVVIGAPVTRCASAAARRTMSSYAVTRPAPVATLITPARMPVSPMPSVSSRTNRSRISRRTSPKGMRNFQYAAPPWSSLYRPVAQTMRTPDAADTSAISSTSRPRSSGQGSSMLPRPRPASSCIRSTHSFPCSRRALRSTAASASHPGKPIARCSCMSVVPSPSGVIGPVTVWMARMAQKSVPNRPASSAVPALRGRRRTPYAPCPTMPRRRALTAVLLVTTALGIGAWVLPRAGTFLVVSDPLPEHADAIVVMAGTVADRALEAATLYAAGRAPRVVVTRERLRRGVQTLRRRGVQLPENEDLTRSVLIQLGVPAAAIVTLRRRNLSTVSEARTIARWACRTRVRALIVVSSRAHTRRLGLILRASLPVTTVVTIVPSRFDGFSGRRWWRVRHDAKMVLSEYEKLADYWLSERWQLSRCGGLERRAALNPRGTSSRVASPPP